MLNELHITKPVFGSWSWLKYVCLITVLSLSIVTAGCTTAQWELALQEIGPAVGVIINIVAVADSKAADTALASKITADTVALDQLITDFEKANAVSQPSLAAQINANFATLQADLGSVYTLANVSDLATQNKLTEEIGLIAGLVEIVEIAIPNLNITPAPVAAGLARPAASVAKFKTVGQFIDAYNAELVTPTGNKAVDVYTSKHKIHIHSKFIRYATGGIAK
jgi:hypothetical protein